MQGERPQTQAPLVQKNEETLRVNLMGHFTCLVKGDPVVVELPGVTGFYVPIFTKKEDMHDAMRYLQVYKYEVVLVGSTKAFYELVRSAQVQVVLNPRAYNGRCVWDQLLPHEEGVIVPGRA